jgi:hypothetical protein
MIGGDVLGDHAVLVYLLNNTNASINTPKLERQTWYAVLSRMHVLR